MNWVTSWRTYTVMSTLISVLNFFPQLRIKLADELWVNGNDIIYLCSRINCLCCHARNFPFLGMVMRKVKQSKLRYENNDFMRQSQ